MLQERVECNAWVVEMESGWVMGAFMCAHLGVVKLCVVALATVSGG